jgi:hypothetical protein
LAAGIWQARAHNPEPVRVASPVLNVETENPRVVRPPAVRAASKPVSPVALSRFSGCAPLTRHLQRKALPMVTPYGIDGIGGFGFNDAVMTMPGNVSRPQGGSGGGASTGGPAAPAPAVARMAVGNHSGTNVQEEGVDEPDIVKTDGTHIFFLSGNVLRAVRAGENPRLEGSLRLNGIGGDRQMLLAADRILVFSTALEGSKPDATKWQSVGHVAVSVVDVSDRSAMRVTQTLHIEGSYVSARLAGGLARLVVRSGPMLPTIQPTEDTEAGAKVALARNKRIVRSAGPKAWLPEFAVMRGGRTVSSGVAVPCNAVHYPKAFAGLSMVTVLTIDPANPTPRDGTTINADADTVYATPDTLYLAAPTWKPGNLITTTQVHQFDIRGSSAPAYVASGELAGRPLNQWSFSEHRGYLRVATMIGWNQESRVVVMKRAGSIIAPVATVGGLGKGEHLYGVRFIGDLGYVVTFIKTDPLFVIDLSNPVRPRLRGELKMLGYSSYLHPVGKDLLLGVGQDATADGLGQGAQVSLFDVSNPAKPVRLDQVKLGTRGTEIDVDHKAFLWWAEKGLAVVAIHHWWNGGTDQFMGAAGVRVNKRSLEEIGRVTHSKAGVGVRVDRSLVVAGRLYTVSSLGIMASALEELAQRSWIAWPS